MKPNDLLDFTSANKCSKMSLLGIADTVTQLIQAWVLDLQSVWLLITHRLKGDAQLNLFQLTNQSRYLSCLESVVFQNRRSQL